MSDVKHSPAPWDYVSLGAFTGVIRAYQGGSIAHVGWFSSIPDKENQANALLISAAPNMLEALPDLSHVISWLENGCDPAKAVAELKIYQQRINQARAKATGGQP